MTPALVPSRSNTRSSRESRARPFTQLMRNVSLTPSLSGEKDRDATPDAVFAIAAVPASPRPSLPMTARTAVVFGAGAAFTKLVVEFRAATQTSLWTDPTIPHSCTGPVTRYQV